MPARFLLIDGYNLLHAAGMARQDYGPGDLQRCRERLLRYLARKLSAAEIARTTVIFDARDPPSDRPAEQVFRELRVQFANPGGDADVVIQEWLERHSAPKRVTLVSSDRVLQRAARRHRAEFIGSEKFFEQMERRRDRAAAPPAGGDGDDAKPGGNLTAAETAHWLQIFGDLAAIARQEELAATTDAGARAGVASVPEKGKSAQETGGKSPTPPRRRSRKKDSAGKGTRNPHISADDVSFALDMLRDLPEAQELARGKSISQADLERWLAEFEKEK